MILITGASKGIGRATAELLAAHGYTVFGTSRNPEMHTADGFILLQLDVRDDELVRACVDSVMKRVGRLDVLVNNAGISLSGAIEDASIEDAKALFETNFFGIYRMVKAVLPIMRAQKGGRIINISSLAGMVGVPYLGHYAASKYALEGYSELLRYEVKSCGIHVSLIEPGDIRSDMWIAQPEDTIVDYGDVRERATRIHDHNVHNGQVAEVVAQAVLRALEAKSPRVRYTVTHRTEKLVPLARRFLPHFLLEWGMRGSYQLDK